MLDTALTLAKTRIALMQAGDIDDVSGGIDGGDDLATGGAIMPTIPLGGKFFK